MVEDPPRFRDAPPPLSGFSIAKNVTIQEYPVEASLRSALALCDQVVVNVGHSEDDTLERIRALDDPRLEIIHRPWPDERGTRLRELSDETNVALDACRHDWALYLQADEVLHEDDFPRLRRRLARAADDDRVEGLLFDYRHFEGSPEWILTGRRRYRREVRVVRRSAGVRSVRDAQGFRIEGRVPRVIRADARVFHYGYVKSRRGLLEKKRISARWYDEDEDEVEPFVFRRWSGLERFEGTHPRFARKWIGSEEWPFDPEEAEPPPRDLETLRIRISDAIERWTGRRLFEHRNYRLIE
jgi:glycosyltransferase involved in cell wall biosynthesis